MYINSNRMKPLQLSTDKPDPNQVVCFSTKATAILP